MLAPRLPVCVGSQGSGWRKPTVACSWNAHKDQRMNRNQAIALAVAGANIVFIMLFPPFDIYSIATSKMPVFGGFDFTLNRNQYMVVNTMVLWLELFVVLINAGIAWLLLGTDTPGGKTRRVSLQGATLIVVAVNLVVILLFPPFESVYTITKATLPSFEGFYFIFARQPNHVIVTTLLYLEVIFILINGALFWLIFRARDPAMMTAEEAYQVMLEMQQRRR